MAKKKSFLTFHNILDHMTPLALFQSRTVQQRHRERKRENELHGSYASNLKITLAGLFIRKHTRSITQQCVTWVGYCTGPEQLETGTQCHTTKGTRFTTPFLWHS